MSVDGDGVARGFVGEFERVHFVCLFVCSLARCLRWTRENTISPRHASIISVNSVE